MANPNIVNVTTIYGNTAIQTCSTTTANIVQNSTGSNKILKINTLTIANINTAAASVSVELNQAGSNVYVTRSVSVPANSSIVVIGKDTGIYLLENHSLQITAGANSTMQAICSYEEIS